MSRLLGVVRAFSGRRERRRRSPGLFGRFAILLLLYFGSYLILRGPTPADPQLIAHRGGTVGVPENTLASFNNALVLGADALEFDVQRTADGVLVVIHDETVDRTTNGTGAVGNLTFEEIRALDAGDGERVPTFEEVLVLAGENNVVILPEAKSPALYPGLAAEMMALVNENDYIADTVIQSFDPAALQAIEQANPAYKTCMLIGLWEFNVPKATPENYDAICPMGEMVVLFPWMIRTAHAEGKTVYSWFGALENPLLARLLFWLGVDGVMVDDPARFIGLIED